MKHLNLTIQGRVQGVWYRKNTEQKAKELELKGFVKNLENGDVYCEVEGLDEQLKHFINWCKKGPDLAKVTKVIQQESEIVNFTDFEIKRTH